MYRIKASSIYHYPLDIMGSDEIQAGWILLYRFRPSLPSSLLYGE